MNTNWFKNNLSEKTVNRVNFCLGFFYHNPSVSWSLQSQFILKQNYFYLQWSSIFPSQQVTGMLQNHHSFPLLCYLQFTLLKEDTTRLFNYFIHNFHVSCILFFFTEQQSALFVKKLLAVAVSTLYITVSLNSPVFKLACL